MAPQKEHVPHWIHNLVPLLLLTVCPPAMFVFWYINTALSGSFTAFWNLVSENGLFETVLAICRPVFFGSPIAWAILGSFAAFQLLLMRIIPGPPFSGPITPKGNIPV